MKIIIDVEVVEKQEKTVLLVLHSGLGDPEIRFAVENVEFVAEKTPCDTSCPPADAWGFQRP